jgi:chromosome segregation ATPase
MSSPKTLNFQLLQIRSSIQEVIKNQKIHEDVLISHNYRFDDMEKRADAVENRLDLVEVRLDKMEVRLTKVEARLDKVEERLDKIEVRLEKLETRMDRLEQKLDQVISLLLAERDERIAMFSIITNHDKRLCALETKLIS